MEKKCHNMNFRYALFEMFGLGKHPENPFAETPDNGKKTHISEVTDDGEQYGIYNNPENSR